MVWEDKKDYIKVENMNSYELCYSNFKGGHSGENIADKKRGNPVKLGIEILSKLNYVYISSIKGGSLVNVIPRDFSVIFSCKNNDAEKIINQEINIQKEFYGEEVNIELKRIENKSKVFSKETTKDIINFINNYNNGALNFDIFGNQILSANLEQLMNLMII